MNSLNAKPQPVSMPFLLRRARQTYGQSVRIALEAVGCADLPREGPLVLGAIHRSGSPMAAIIQTLGVSKQAAGRLIDLLVQKDYLIRELDPQDRRRFILALSERGGIAARAIYGALRLVDERLESQIGADALQQLRFNLQVIAELELDIV